MNPTVSTQKTLPASSFTKGPVLIEEPDEFCIFWQIILESEGNPLAETYSDGNAELIAEAFNVATETGLTPRQMVEQRNELLEACERAMAYADSWGEHGLYVQLRNAVEASRPKAADSVQEGNENQ
jgi:hypothetical protein